MHQIVHSPCVHCALYKLVNSLCDCVNKLKQWTLRLRRDTGWPRCHAECWSCCGMPERTSLTWFSPASHGLNSGAGWMNPADPAPCQCAHQASSPGLFSLLVVWAPATNTESHSCQCALNEAEMEPATSCEVKIMIMFDSLFGRSYIPTIGGLTRSTSGLLVRLPDELYHSSVHHLLF